MRVLVLLALVGCAMPLPARTGGAGMFFGTGGTFAPASATVTSGTSTERVRGNGASHGEVHPFAALGQFLWSADVVRGDACALGIDLAIFGHNGLTGRCRGLPWLTVEAHAAWQLLGGPVTHVAALAQHAVDRWIVVGGLRASAGRHEHWLELPDAYATDLGFEPGMGGARGRFERFEARVELPVSFVYSIDESGGVAFGASLWWTPYADDADARCDGCLPGVAVGDFEAAYGVGITFGVDGKYPAH